MRIALDARPFTDNAAGRETGAASLLVRELAAVRRDWRILEYHHEGPWSRLKVPLSAWRDRADVLITGNLPFPPLLPCPVIACIDHVNPLDAPRGLTVADVIGFERRLRATCRRSTRIICPTAHLGSRLVAEFGAKPGRVCVVSPGHDESLQRVDSSRWSEVLQRYDLSRPFVLHHGPDEPRRNTRRLIEAWAMSDLKVRQRMQLAIVGMSDVTGHDLVNVVNRLGLAASVRLYSGFGDEGDLPAMLSAADIAAFPHVAAGFPHQVLEAWAARAAVLTSDHGGIAEVAGDAALLADPNDAGAIARGLGRLMRDARLRRDLVERGQQRLLRFSWRHAAERFARVIEDVVANRTPARSSETGGETLRRAA